MVPHRSKTKKWHPHVTIQQFPRAWPTQPPPKAQGPRPQASEPQASEPQAPGLLFMRTAQRTAHSALKNQQWEPPQHHHHLAHSPQPTARSPPQPRGSSPHRPIPNFALEHGHLNIKHRPRTHLAARQKQKLNPVRNSREISLPFPCCNTIRFA